MDSIPMPVMAESNKVPKKPMINRLAKAIEINMINCDRGDLDFNIPVIM